MSSDLYREQIIDLYENPLHYGSLEEPTFTYEEDNPLCGDVIRIDVELDENNRVKSAAWSGDGCAISQAAASLLTDDIMGKSLDDLRAYDKDEILEMIGVPLSMMRVKCALLCLKVLKAGAYGLPEAVVLRGTEQ
ncbi:MAG TPA: iron-sulfur cluster assembly scaffold protein [Anaerolineae bacterium]|nr:iron-sulfur cluster assembly scaffold protein [Anaerolineae bacterium]